MSTPHGRFIWYDVMTTDKKAATAFYGDIIGWDACEKEIADGHTYTVFSKGRAMAAGLMAIPEATKAEGATPCWFGYIATGDVDADAARVWAAGGEIKRLPEDIPNVGRFAVATDPGGAVFLLFKPNTREEPNPAAPMTPGRVGWHELYAGDLDREFAFYSRLFGWTKDRAIDMGPMGTYQTFSTDGTPCGGMMNRCSQVPRACWNYYITVDSVAVAAARAAERGAVVLNGPIEVPGGAWIVQARDPQGAAFSMISACK
jgi:uncharacterized protein